MQGHKGKISSIEIPWYAASGAMALASATLYPESPQYILLGVASLLNIGAGISFGYWWRKSGRDKKFY